MILQNLNLRLLRSQILPYNLKMWQSALSQPRKKTAQIATIEICAVFGYIWLMAIDQEWSKHIVWLMVIDQAWSEHVAKSIVINQAWPKYVA